MGGTRRKSLGRKIEAKQNKGGEQVVNSAYLKSSGYCVNLIILIPLNYLKKGQ